MDKRIKNLSEPIQEWLFQHHRHVDGRLMYHEEDVVDLILLLQKDPKDQTLGEKYLGINWDKKD